MLENAEHFLQRCQLEEQWHETYNGKHNTVVSEAVTMDINSVFGNSMILFYDNNK